MTDFRLQNLIIKQPTAPKDIAGPKLLNLGLRIILIIDSCGVYILYQLIIHLVYNVRKYR